MSFSLHKVPFVEWTYTEGNTSGMTALSERLSLASDNLRQTLPIFLVFAVLSVVLEVDNLLNAQLWLGFRILYLLGAVFNLYKFKMVRPVIWTPSVLILFMMGANLVT